jgi:hypothetical protein
VKRFRSICFYITLAGVLLSVTSGCGRRQDELPPVITETDLGNTAIPTFPEVVPQITKQVVQMDNEPVQLAAREFFDLIHQGEIDRALSYWDLHAEDVHSFERILQEWYVQGFQFVIGDIAYSGFVAPDDFQDLEQDDPRATTASVEVMIDGQPYYLMLGKSNGVWRMNGLLVRDSDPKDRK